MVNLTDIGEDRAALFCLTDSAAAAEGVIPVLVAVVRGCCQGGLLSNKSQEL